MKAEPQAFRWSNGAMIPMHQRSADRVFVTERIYWLVEASSIEPSGKSWRHQWAVVQSAWASLPEDLKDTYPSPDALRKRALISAGYYDETMIEVGDQATAGRLATSLRRVNDVSHVRIQDGHVFQRTAKSQKDMERDEFERSKAAIFEVIADLLSITVDELTKEGG